MHIIAKLLSSRNVKKLRKFVVSYTIKEKMNGDEELIGDVVIPKVTSQNQNSEDILPLGYEALPRSASTVRRSRRCDDVI